VAIEGADRELALIVAISTHACAIPLRHVAETMRPLSIEPIAGMPRFVVGVSVIRGAPVPIVDLKALLEDGERSASYGRFVTLKVGERRVAVGVDGVVGVRSLAAAQLADLPPIMRDVRTDCIAAIGSLDAQLLVVLHAARIVPDEVWTSVAADAQAAR